MRIIRMNKGEGWGNTKAFIDIETDEGIIIKGFRLVDGRNGLFISCPSHRVGNTYYDDVVIPKELKDELQESAVREYNGGDNDEEKAGPF